MSKFVILNFLLVILTLLVSGCSIYSKILNSGTPTERYTLANQLFEKEKYEKANSLYELILGPYHDKSEREMILLHLAESSFKLEDFNTAIHYYDIFLNNFPRSTKIEEGLFKIAESYYHLSADHHLDQSKTKKALEAYQNFIDKNPDSKKISDANAKIKVLNHKLETKFFEIAKLYYKIGNYKSAIMSFENLILNHLGTKYKEEAVFLKFKSSYKLAVKSIPHKKKKRIDDAIENYIRYKRNFPKSKYLEDSDNLYKKLLQININS